MSEFQKILDAKKHYDELLKQVGKSSFLEAYRGLLAAHPLLESVTWTQHTPSWNDGEPCHFGVGEVRVRFIDPAGNAVVEQDEVDEDDGSDGPDDKGYIDATDARYWTSPRGSAHRPTWVTDEHIAAMSAVATFHSSVPEDVLEVAFGDPARVAVDRKGVTVEEYDCD